MTTSTPPISVPLLDARRVTPKGTVSARRRGRAKQTSGQGGEVTTLHDIAAHEPDNGTYQLAKVIHHWAQQHGVELAAPPVQQQGTTRRGIEIDL